MFGLKKKYNNREKVSTYSLNISTTTYDIMSGVDLCLTTPP